MGLACHLPRDIHVSAFFDSFLHLYIHLFGKFLGSHSACRYLTHTIKHVKVFQLAGVSTSRW